MKKLLTYIITLFVTISMTTPIYASAANNEFNILSGDNGQFGYKIINETPLFRFTTSSIEVNEFDNSVEIQTNLNYFTQNGDIKIELDLPEGAYLTYMSNYVDNDENGVILILDKENNLLGIIDHTYIITKDGKKIKAGNTIVNENTIMPLYDENIKGGTMVNILASALNFNQYFEYLTLITNYGTAPQNTSFELKIRIDNINALASSVPNASYLLWEAASDKGSSIYGATWSNAAESLRKQFNCHYAVRQYKINTEGTSEGLKWNLEPWRSATYTFDYLINRCNP